MNINNITLIDCLLQTNTITEDQKNKVLSIQEMTHRPLHKILIDEEIISENQMSEIIQQYFNIPFVDLKRLVLDSKLQELIPYSLAVKYNVIPFKVDAKKLYIAMEDPFDLLAIDDIKKVCETEIIPCISSSIDIRQSIEHLYREIISHNALEDFETQMKEYKTNEQPRYLIQTDSVRYAPIVRFLNNLIEEAVFLNASDIHIEPYESKTRVRYRLDGILVNKLFISADVHLALITRIKIISELNIAQNRLPQEGHFKYSISGRDIDFRVSIIPTINGEKAVIRLLDKNTFFIPKSQLGLTQNNLANFEGLLKNSNGIILVTGPAGSGKTTTLYTMINELNKTSRNIITIEDPVEYSIEGINQMQVNPQAGLDFATGLRSILRQDPNVIMIGEIRDYETASIAVQAAITGHLVLSTLHTNDSVSAITRMLNMGIEPYLLAASLRGIISQRLIRKVCKQCCDYYTPSSYQLDMLGMSGEYNNKFARNTGCRYCSSTGYKGRIGIFEVLVISKMHRELVTNGSSYDEFLDYSLKNGLSTLKTECINLLYKGVTTMEEVLKVIYSFED